MKAVIIAGGLGTRLRPLTYNTPKPIVPVLNRPFIVHQVELLKQHGVDEIILNLHYLSDNIREILDDGKEWGVKICYSIEEKPLGTAGAVKNAEEYFKDEELIVVFNGDILTDANISEIIKLHRSKKARATLTLTPVDDPTSYGLVLCDEKGRVQQFLEKPSWERVEGMARKNINAGIYILDPKIFRSLPSNEPVTFERQVFPDLLEKGEPVYGFESDAYWIDIGNPEKYRLAHQAALRGDVTLVRIIGRREKGGIWIGDRAEIDRSAKVYGPSVIGSGVKIGGGAVLREYAVVGDKVEIGANSMIENTIIWNGCRIGANVKLNDCILGFNCVIEDGVSILKGGVIADNTFLSRGTIFNA
ncbi:MAG TPA: NDP-sugar synthase [Candidatus Omnitrophota bacterium]|nr:NDP-sugar synthase [Candidatus Omnitrophota bacterium]